jgi:hypothetical protein
MPAVAAEESAGDKAGNRLTTVDGPVDVGRGEPLVWQTASAGMTLEPGDAIRTGAAARAEAFIRGATVRLYENSLLRVAAHPAAGTRSGSSADSELGATLQLGLDRGRALFDVLLGRETRSVDVETPKVVVSVRGTRFSVDAMDHAVSVFRGQVAVRGLSSELRDAILVRQGFSAHQLETGKMELLSVPVADPWSSWSQGAHYPAALHEDALRPARERAMEDAAKAARQNAAPRALERAVERNPAVRERIADKLSDRSGKQDQRERERDTVIDRNDKRIDDDLSGTFVDQLLDPGGATGGSLEFTRETSGGPNRIIVTDPTSGFTTTLLEEEVRDIVKDQAPVPGELLNQLGSTNLSAEDFKAALKVYLSTH